MDTSGDNKGNNYGKVGPKRCPALPSYMDVPLLKDYILVLFNGFFYI